MRKLAFILITLATMLGWAAPSNAAEFEWSHWGSCPFGEGQTADEQRANALSRLDEAMEHMSMPDAVKAAFREAVREHPDGQERQNIQVGDRFEEMQSCHGHLITGGIRVAEYDSTGRRLQMGSARWHFTHDGKVYTLVLPDTCYNWAWTEEEAPPPPAPQQRVETPPSEQEPCAILRADDVHAGDDVILAVLGSGELPASACWAIRDGTEVHNGWPPGCESSCVMSAIRTLRFGPQILRNGRYRMQSNGPLYVRVPLAVARANEVALCLKRDNRTTVPSGVVPSDWNGGNRVVMSSWRWADGATRERRR